MRKPKTKIARCPTHPGEILREDILPALNVSVTDAAKELGIARQTLHRLMAGEIAVSPEMAVRLGKWCANGPNIWLKMQVAYDLWHAERRLAGALAEIPSHLAA
ncbi:MAG: HigA family addiction module antidote protein [Gammaproteobacteria bacterium]|nr:HigA family addiction module antidote protein [Gammaproteobacteria bacterium]